MNSVHDYVLYSNWYTAEQNIAKICQVPQIAVWWLPEYSNGACRYIQEQTDQTE